MKSLFSHLPAIWKDLDIKTTQVVAEKGLLERYLNVGDAGLQRIEDYIKEFLRSHNSEEIRDQFLPLFIALTGTHWRSTRGRVWNRNRIQSSITRASYKGSHQCILDLAREYGASFCEIKDMASTVLVESKQGTYGNDDSWFFDSDYYHPGVFQIFLSDDIDLIGFEEEFPFIRPTGTKWYFRIIIQDTPVVINQLTGSIPEVIVDAGDNTYGTRFFIDPYGVFEYYDWVPQAAYTSYIRYVDSTEDIVFEPDLMVPIEMVTYSVPEVMVGAGINTHGTSFFSSLEEFYEYTNWVPQAATDIEYVTFVIPGVLLTMDILSTSFPEVVLDAPDNTYGSRFYDDQYGVFEYYDWVSQSAYDVEI